MKMPDRDAQQPNMASLGARIRSIEDTFKHFLDNTFRTYLEQDSAWKSAMATKMDSLSRPNLTLLVSVLALVAVIGMAVLNGVTGKIDANDRRQTEGDARHTHDSEKLDERLQREYNLANGKINSDVESLNHLSKERHDTAMEATKSNASRILAIENWDREKIKSDLEELRQRRMRDGAPAAQ